MSEREYAKGGWLPGRVESFRLDPDECVVRVPGDDDATWAPCTRRDPAHEALCPGGMTVPSRRAMRGADMSHDEAACGERDPIIATRFMVEDKLGRCGMTEDPRMDAAVLAAWPVLFRYGLVQPRTGWAWRQMHVEGTTDPDALEAMEAMRKALLAAFHAYGIRWND